MEDVYETFYWYEMTRYPIYIHWECQGGHEGNFCGGHLRLDITAYIYGLTKEQMDDTEAEYEGKVSDENPWEKVDTDTIIINEEKLDTAQDIYDIDMSLNHAVEPEDWEGWDKNAMKMVGLKYSQDFMEIYGFDIPAAIGALGKACYNPLDFDWGTSITSYFGYRIQPAGSRTGTVVWHKGIDIANSEYCTTGTPLKACQDGIIKIAADTPNAASGRYVMIEDEEGYQYQYMHLNEISVTQGQEVKHGDIIGTVGNTGDSTGAHLHFGMLTPDGEYVNPAFYTSRVVE